MKKIPFDVKDKEWKNYFTVGVSKMKRKKNWVFIFLNAHSLRGFDPSYLNLMKLAYQTLLSSDFSAQPWKWSEYLKKINNIVSQKLAKRAMHLVTKKDHTKCKISYMTKKSQFFCKILSLYRINNFCVVIEIYAS